MRDMRTDLVSTPAACRDGEVETSRFVEAAAIRHAVHQDDRVTPLDVLLQLAVLVLFTDTNIHYHHHHHHHYYHYHHQSHTLDVLLHLCVLVLFTATNVQQQQQQQQHSCIVTGSLPKH